MYYVYRFLNADNEVIYVGKTQVSMESRISTHFSTKSHLPIECYKQVDRIEYMEIDNKIEMDIKELYYINYWKPIYNTKDKNEEEFNMSINEEREWKLFQHKSISAEMELKRLGKVSEPTWNVISLVGQLMIHKKTNEDVKEYFNNIIDSVYEHYGYLIDSPEDTEYKIERFKAIVSYVKEKTS